MSRFFDNAMVRFRNDPCLVATVAPPFAIGYWPDLEALLQDLNMTEVSVESLQDSLAQSSFLFELAERVSGGEVFLPRTVDFKSRARGQV